MGTTVVTPDGTFSHPNDAGGKSTAPPPVTAVDPEGRITQARSEGGRRLTGDKITENDIVSINGGESTIKAWEAMGYLQRNHDGSFSMTDKATGMDKLRPKGIKPGNPTEAAPETGEAASDDEDTDQPAMEGLDGDTETLITEVANGAQPSDVLSSIMSVAKTGEFNQAAMGRIASSLGQEPEAVMEKANSVRAAFESQAIRTVEKTGLSSDDVFGWAYEHEPKMMQEAIRQHTNYRHTEGYQPVIQKYVQNLDTINPDMILNAQFGEGVEAFRDDGGRIVLKSEKGTVPWKTAVRIGMVSLGRAR
ncbi:hypothetical protein [Magnetospira sp. QH-2]|uniref:hypothetical protein n=1 Tax=Magnetospira sp. (strain QH-2) TaxID=1288970 RepID=UPI0003E813BE|nr:hypothetical protein [Magnetospira sp. QH-2]CCQ73925.1 Conserved protein of unknown function [Magnetospira sp. QH-2]